MIEMCIFIINRIFIFDFDFNFYAVRNILRIPYSTAECNMRNLIARVS